MRSQVYSIQSAILRPFVQYVLFNQRTLEEPVVQVTSFPNTNFCLGIAKDKMLSLDNDLLVYKPKPGVHSYISGMYSQPHRINITGALDEICIDFTASGYEQFFSTPPQVYVFEENVLELNFGKSSEAYFLETFDESDLTIRGKKIESLLLDLLKQSKLQEDNNFIHQISKVDCSLSVKDLSLEIPMSPRTLQRKFLSTIGITPKKYLQIRRFRDIIAYKMSNNSTFNWEEVAFQFGYYDYSHMHRDFAKLTNETPITFFSNVHHIDDSVAVHQCAV